MPETRDENYQLIKTSLNITIVNNLKKLLDIRGIKQRSFCNSLSISVTRSHLNQILNHPEKNIMPIALLLSCCDALNVPVNELVSDTFDSSKYADYNTNTTTNYINVENTLQQYAEYENSNHNSSEPDSPLTQVSSNNNSLIINPNSIHFKGYLQDYYCYYYPTYSSGNKDKLNIVRGKLSLTPENNYCKAILTIDTNTQDANGNTNYKKYIGYATISTTVKNLHCIMYSEEISEYCFLMFRYFNINYGKQDCRIAEVLTSSSATEDRQPTVLRMLLSREELSNDDLQFVAPSFALNYSNIAITNESLLKAANKFQIEQEFQDFLLENKISEPIFIYKEKELVNIASKILQGKDLDEFLMYVRSFSLSYRYNKVSKKADNTVRKILVSRGYYKKSRV